jgi:hypothetical protein
MHELRTTLFFVAGTQNITLSLPRELLKRIKRLATDREVSLSSLMIEALVRWRMKIGGTPPLAKRP